MNIGCVIYKKDVRSGGQTAKWQFENETEVVGGTGTATGSPGASYAGEYEITYYVEDKPDGPYKLIIEEENDYFKLSWYQDDELKYSGIGLLNGPFLAAGWKSTAMEDQL